MARFLLSTLAWSVLGAGVTGPVAELLGIYRNRDRTVEVSRQFERGRAERASDSQVYVVYHTSSEAGSWWSIDQVRVALPGDPTWIVTENRKGYFGVKVDKPPVGGWQEPLDHHYTSPTPVHVLDGADGRRVMTDEDIHYWLTSWQPPFWHGARVYGWYAMGYALLGVVGVSVFWVLLDAFTRRRRR